MVGVEVCKERKRRRVPSAQSLSRTLALEQAYVHDVYAAIALTGDSPTPPAVHAQVKQFMEEQFEPGSLLLDVGCSDGKYLNLNPDIVVLGLEHCAEWFSRGGETCKSSPKTTGSNPNHLAVGDVMYLPFRDELFDGVLCCSVLHHLSTTERRLNALKEIARVMKIGGKVMLTVTSGPAGAKDLGSQDVLIRFDRNAERAGDGGFGALNYFSGGGSDFDSKSYSSSLTNSSLELNNAYENCASSPTSSEFENCYSFVKKALKRFSITSSIYSMKNSLSEGSSAKSKYSTALSLHDEMYPIELRNLEEGAGSDSSGCLSQTSSNVNHFNGTVFPSTLLAAIKEHLSNWKVQFANSIVWHAMDGKADGDGTAHRRQQHQQMQYRQHQTPIYETADMVDQTQPSHRLSLPSSLRNGPAENRATHNHHHHPHHPHHPQHHQRHQQHHLPQHRKSGGTLSSSLSTRSNSVVRGHGKNKHKVYAVNEGGIGGKPVMANFEIDGVVKQVELNLSQVILPRTRDDSVGERKGLYGRLPSHHEAIALATVVRPSEQQKAEEEKEVVAIEAAKRVATSESKAVPGKDARMVLQKSFSSDSSRSFECTGYKLIAYYSMPELRTIVDRPEGEAHQQPTSSSKGVMMMMMHGQSSSETASSMGGAHLHSLETETSSDPLQQLQLQQQLGSRQGTPSSQQSESKECLLAEMELELELSRSECDSVELLEVAAVPLPPPSPVAPSPALSDCKTDCETEADRSLADEMKENPSTLQQAGGGKFPKKLLRQRSFSADYQPEVVKFQPELPRRFSASPNIGTHRYNSSSHTPHQQQISIDSEESFVTIIPANHSRCTRDNSMADVAVTGGACGFASDFDLELEDFEGDLMTSNEDVSPNEIDQYDSPSDEADDDAYCENLSNDEFDSDDNTSISSVLEATIRSAISNKSADSLNSGGELEELPDDAAQKLQVQDAENDDDDDDDDDDENDTSGDDEDGEQCNGQSAPTTLHRYFHLFRGGELENLIEEHIQNLHIIDSFYNEYATSWCIVAEKINVWTI
ncbi:hypothetical protein TYRP_004552 [Tyrophagus putrescentiae]|nr:hypothetical protein TYRP_004552 [Tyrophagus putrescentiae]